MKVLQMSLTTQWFYMTTSGTKPEEYRAITPYWAARLFTQNFPFEEPPNLWNFWDDVAYDLLEHPLEQVMKAYWLDFKEFDINRMTLGYPMRGSKDRICDFEHIGIEVRTGKSEWGAEPGKIYFVINHGEML